jgi:hypothetical protein
MWGEGGKTSMEFRRRRVGWVDDDKEYYDGDISVIKWITYGIRIIFRDGEEFGFWTS